MQNGIRKNMSTPRRLGSTQRLLKMRSPLLPHWLFVFFMLSLSFCYMISFVLLYCKRLLYISVVQRRKSCSVKKSFHFNFCEHILYKYYDTTLTIECQCFLQIFCISFPENSQYLCVSYTALQRLSCTSVTRMN